MTACTHGPTAHMRPGSICSFCGNPVSAAEIVASATGNGSPRPFPSFVPGVPATLEGAAAEVPVLHSGHTRPVPVPVPGTVTSPDRRPIGPITGSPAPVPHPHQQARTLDPITSHEAGWNVNGHADIYRAILTVLFEHGPSTDYDLSVRVPGVLARGSDRQPGPLLRTSAGKRRHDLQDLGLVADSGHKGRTDTGARAIRWGLTTAGRRALERAAA